MLVPAIAYKEELEKEFHKHIYNNEYFYYMGYAHGHELPKIEPRDNYYQWAIIGKDTKIVKNSYDINHLEYINPLKGYFAYQIQPETDCVLNFGLYSFDKGNALVGHDVYEKMEQLALLHHRIEWRCIGSNPALKGYRKFLSRIGKLSYLKTNEVKLHDVTKTSYGVYCDEYIFEIVNIN